MYVISEFFKLTKIHTYFIYVSLSLSLIYLWWERNTYLHWGVQSTLLSPPSQTHSDIMFNLVTPWSVMLTHKINHHSYVLIAIKLLIEYRKSLSLSDMHIFTWIFRILSLDIQNSKLNLSNVSHCKFLQASVNSEHYSFWQYPYTNLSFLFRLVVGYVPHFRVFFLKSEFIRSTPPATFASVCFLNLLHPDNVQLVKSYLSQIT